MTPTEPDLAAWLLEQIAEDERVAMAVPRQSWRVGEESDKDWGPNSLLLGDDAERGDEVVFHWEEAARHSARWDPRRVLAECDAKRRLVDLHEPVNGHCSTCLESESDLYGKTFETAPCMNLRLLAAPYADRPGYREEWRV